MVSSKFFRLIRGDHIEIAENSRIIQADAFSSLLDAKGLLEEVKKDAKAYRQSVAAECELLKEQAQKEGYEAGFEQWAEHVADLEVERRNAREEYSKVIVSLAIQAAKKVIGRELELNPDAVVDIVINTLKAVKQHKEIVIYCNRVDLNILESNKPKLKAIFENVKSITIQERSDIDEGGYVIETERGIINFAETRNRWDSLEEAFEKLMEQKV
ncbi:MAG: HrpE/YscL family type III secretion apparatus protein [Waddliaceae bacterium]|nr:HrpE/YscL family type III secretion apparatus protein [Waddliaceae bacterium]